MNESVVSARGGRGLRFVVLSLLLPAAMARPVMAASQEETPCVNFGEVRPGFYRGADPTDRCLEHLVTLGVRKVVSLRNDEEASERERTRVTALGMRYVSMPMSGFDRPSYAQVRRILAVVGSSGNEPVFLHCRRGRDRTGVIVAADRMIRDGWTVDRALQEAGEYGMAWWQFPMKRFVRDFGATSGKNPRRLDEFRLNGHSEDG